MNLSTVHYESCTKIVKIQINRTFKSDKVPETGLDGNLKIKFFTIMTFESTCELGACENATAKQSFCILLYRGLGNRVNSKISVCLLAIFSSF